MAQDKTNAALKFGKFGIRHDELGPIELTPSGGVGYVLHDVYVELMEDSPNEASFVAKLYLNGSAL